MKIKNNELKIPIILNLVIVFFLYFDLLLPSNKIIKEEFVSFYNIVTKTQSFKRSGGKQVRNVLECKSGNLYYLLFMPDYEHTVKNKNVIYIKKTLIFSKVKSLKILGNKKCNLSLLSNKCIIFFFLFQFL